MSQDVPEIVASNLSRIRRARGLSISELARISRVAKATISKLELSRGNPTIATMFALADALGTPLGELIAEDRASTQLVRATDGSRVTRGVVEARYINRIQTALDLIEIYELDVDPEQAEESLPHRRGVYEHVFVLSGCMLVGPSEDLHELETGDYICFRADYPHRYVAKGAPARALCLVHYPNAVPGVVTDGSAGINLEVLPRSTPDS